MKKIGFFLVMIMLFVTGCNNSKVLRIDAYDWVMSSVQSMAEKGQVVAFGERGSSTLDTAKKVEFVCKAENGKLMLSDQTNDKNYTGTYKLSQTDSQSSICQVIVEGKEGMAVVSMTSYHNGKQEPTCIISLGDYSINLFAE